MRDGEGSRTAERVAARRAAHQLLDSPLVFEDPIALSVVAPSIAQRLRTEPEAFDRSRVGRALRAFLAARSRFAEDELEKAVANGVRQYVILGAGFDTFAYRNPHRESGLRVFEVDHPATQAVKRARLGGAQLAPAGDVTFVAADLQKVAVGQALDDAGFDRSAGAFFSWLGVVPYLELPAIRATLQCVAALPGGATIVFDYGVPVSSFGWLTRFAFRRIAKRVAAIGEPWKTFFKPELLRDELHRAGFTFATDFGPEELNRRYFTNRRDRLRVGSLGHIAMAGTVVHDASHAGG